jgi:hypothetical protein
MRAFVSRAMVRVRVRVRVTSMRALVSRAMALFLAT